MTNTFTKCVYLLYASISVERSPYIATKIELDHIEALAQCHITAVVFIEKRSIRWYEINV